MKLLIEVPDKKANFIIEVLNNFSYIKTKIITKEKKQILSELNESVQQINSFKKGKIKLRNARDFLKTL